ncbi:MAG: hypothetical protein Q9208_001662 [Pyrenodesmia sp. 3 TL-2023]
MASKTTKLDDPDSPPSSTQLAAPSKKIPVSGNGSQDMRLSTCPSITHEPEPPPRRASAEMHLEVEDFLHRGLADAEPKHKPGSPPTLLALPAEIRANILSYVLISPDPLRIDKHGRATQTEWSLCQTCRQVYLEAVPIFYAQNVFLFGIRRWGYVRRHWLKNIKGENLCLIRSVQLEPWVSSKWPKVDMLASLKKIIIQDKEYDVEGYKALGQTCSFMRYTPAKYM